MDKRFHYADPKAIERHRIENGWSQSQLASKANVSLATVQRAEAVTSNYRMRTKTAAKIAKALGVDVVEITNPYNAGPSERVQEKVHRSQRHIIGDDYQSTGEPKCIFSLEGIVLNSVGEVLYGRVPESTVVECRHSYRRAIEDFSFAVVYGSELRSRWAHPARDAIEREKEPKRKEPAELLISSLPMAIYDGEQLDSDCLDAILLGDEGHRNQIRTYIRQMGECLNEQPLVVKLCRDLIVRESVTCMGTHRNLFRLVKDTNEIQFGKKYWEHRLLKEVPNLLGQPAVSQLVEFVPKRPSDSKEDRYTKQTRHEFVMRIVLTHIGTMYQLEQHCEKRRELRMPYALRAEIAKRVWKTETQRLLRHLVVRHALMFALHDIPPHDRQLLVPVLVSLRGEPRFAIIREWLEEMSLVHFRFDPRSEERASALIQDIRNASNQATEPTESYSLSRNSVLKEIASVDPTEYEMRLARVFPELKGPSS